MKPNRQLCVCVGMDAHLTIADYAARHGVSESTVRRRIKAGLIAAELRNGKYAIPDDGVPSQDAHVDQPAPSQNGNADSPLVVQMQSEIDNLRGQLSNRDTQIDQLNQILAMTSAQNAELTRQLPATEDPAPKQPILSRLKTLFGLQT